MRELLVFYPLIKHITVLLVAAFALFGAYRLARLLTNKEVAVATVICVSLYPVFLSEVLLAHREIVCAALVVWGFYFYLKFGSMRAAAVVILISTCALALWLSSQGREMTNSLSLFKALALRLWQVTGHGGLFVLTLFGLLAMTRQPLSDDKVERRRIDLGVQAVMGLAVAAYVVVQSFKGGEARDVLPVIPLVMLIWISTLYRRVRRWRVLVGIVCAVFVLEFILSRLS